MNILFIHDGHNEYFQQGWLFLNHLNFPGDSTITVFVPGRKKNETTYENVSSFIQSSGSSYSFVLEYSTSGYWDQAISYTNSKEWDLVVFCEIKISDHHFNLKRTNRSEKLVKKIHKPLLLVRNKFDTLRKILVCSSGESVAQLTLGTAGKLLAQTRSEILLLHVMSQIALKQPGLEADLLDNAESAMDRKTKEGKHFTTAIRTLRKNGFTGDIYPKLRHGLVVDEVLDELKTEECDLMVIGSHHQAGRSKFIEFLLEDVTKILITETKASVLVVG